MLRQLHLELLSLILFKHLKKNIQAFPPKFQLVDSKIERLCNATFSENKLKKKKKVFTFFFSQIVNVTV